MADREIIRPEPKSSYGNITDTAYRWFNRLCEEINRIRGGTRMGTLNNYTEIESDGTIRFVGTATTWRDINFPLIGLANGASAPDIGTVGGGTIEYLLFAGAATTEGVAGVVELNHEVKLDVIKPHIHWMPTTAAAGNVKWQLTYSITNAGDALTETTIFATVAAPGAVQTVFTTFSDIDVSAFSPGAQFAFYLFRDPTDVADTYGADAATLTFGLHVEVESMGTRTVSGID